MFLFWNDGRRFHDSVSAWGEGLDEPIVARGLAVSDGDGDPDIAVAINRGRPLLLDNLGEPRGNWLGVRLGGSDPAAVGARVEAEGETTRTIRWTGADVSFASQHSAELLFGLGADAHATVEVRFANSRRVRLLDLPAGARYLIPPLSPAS